MITVFLLAGLIDVQLLAPTNGETVKGAIQVTASVTATNSPVQRIEFRRDGELIQTIYPPQPGKNMKATIL